MRTIVIGAGHNGLTAAFYLAKARLKPLVLERRGVVGGAAVTEEIAPGYRCPALAHVTGPMRASIVRDMELARRLEFVVPDPRVAALAEDGPALTFHVDPRRTAEAIRSFSSRDADRYVEFCGLLRRLGAFIAPLLESTPPSLDASSPAELWELLKIGRRFRALGRPDEFRLLRYAPMAVADLVAEWFETPLLQAAIAARAVFGTAQGPWSAGTGAVLLLNAAMDPAPEGSSVMVKGGPGALAAAMADAAREAGAEIRTNSGVARIAVRNGRVAGVLLDDGSMVEADVVVSNADPRRTLLDMLDPVDLGPACVTRARNYRCRGATAKMNLALSSLPSVRGIPDPAALGGRIHIGPDVDYLERAFDASKYGEISQDPYLDITIPTLHDPSLAPEGRHVMSVVAQFAPYQLAKGRDWTSEKETLRENVLRTLERVAPGITALVEHEQVVTPIDLEATYGLTGGHIFHGEPALDQLFTMRPFLGFAQYRTPIEGLYLCGAGTHPGGGLTAAPGRNAAAEILKRHPAATAR